MAQRLILNKAPFKIEMIIDDNELTVFEFSDFWEEVKKETNISIDTYSNRGINLEVNRKFTLMLSTKLYKIEEEFPESKISKFDNKKQISKTVVIRFFNKLIDILNIAYDQKLTIGIDGE